MEGVGLSAADLCYWLLMKQSLGYQVPAESIPRDEAMVSVHKGNPKEESRQTYSFYIIVQEAGKHTAFISLFRPGANTEGLRIQPRFPIQVSLQTHSLCLHNALPVCSLLVVLIAIFQPKYSSFPTWASVRTSQSVSLPALLRPRCATQ